MSVSSIKNNYQNFNPSVSDSVGRLRNNKTISLNKKRERSKRLYNRNSDIYLPDISKDLKNNRGKSMMNLYDDTTPSKFKVDIYMLIAIKAPSKRHVSNLKQISKLQPRNKSYEKYRANIGNKI